MPYLALHADYPPNIMYLNVSGISCSINYYKWWVPGSAHNPSSSAIVSGSYSSIFVPSYHRAPHEP